MREHPHELVPTEPGKDASVTERAAQAVGDGTDDPVPERVVDVLQPVDASEEQRDRVAIATGDAEGLLRELDQQPGRPVSPSCIA